MKKLIVGVLVTLSITQAGAAGTNINYQQVVDAAYATFQHDTSGKVADYIPALARYSPKLYGIALVTVDGKVYTAGDAKATFPLESLSKIFTLSLALQQSGASAVLNKIGANATGMQFNSVLAVEEQPNHVGNSLVNAGAIATVSMIQAKNRDERWNMIYENLNNFATTKLKFNQEVYRSEMENNQHNQGIAHLLDAYDHLYSDPDEAIDVYTRECSVDASAIDLAKMGVVFANKGKSPFTGKQLLQAGLVPHLLAEMVTAGMYNNSGNWLYQVGLPAKSGVGGGMVAIVPGRFAIAVYSPALDEAGNSIRAQATIAYIAKVTNANLFN